jgi:hypothetical protein
MNRPILGAINCETGYGCVRCDSHEDRNLLTNLWHDLRCWGIATALYNARLRLFPPDWFAKEQAA